MLLAALSCWQRQDHDILRPNIPNYTLSGYTVDLDDTTRVLPNTPINLQSVAMLYDVTFDPVSILADSNGYFRIDSVYPGIFVISAARGGYTIVKKQFDMGHDDLTYHLALPKPLFIVAYYPIGARNPRFAWGSNWLWRFGTFRIPEQPPKEVIYRGTIQSGRFVAERRYPNPYPSATSFTYANGNLYMHFGDTLAVLPVADPSFVATAIIEDPFHGLAWDGTGFWATYTDSLQYRGSNPVSVENVFDANTGFLGSLAARRSEIWVYDMDRDLILKMNIRGETLGSFRPPIGTVDNTEVHDMEFGWDGLLWVSSKSGGIFTFDVE